MDPNNKMNKNEQASKAEGTVDAGARVINVAFVWLLLHSGMMLFFAILPVVVANVWIWGNFALLGAYLVLAFLLKRKIFVAWLIALILLGVSALGGIIRIIAQKGGDVLPIITAILAFIFVLRCYRVMRPSAARET